MRSALIPLAEGFEEIEAVTIVDVLRRGGVEVVTAALGAEREVTGAHGMKVTADAAFADAAGREFDAVVLPGGPGVGSMRGSAPLVERLRQQHAEGRLIAAICAAPLVLTDNAIVEPDIHLTCYPSCATELDRRPAGVPVVADGGVITGEAPGSAMLFALVVLQTLQGEDVARKVARGMVTDDLQ